MLPSPGFVLRALGVVLPSGSSLRVRAGFRLALVCALAFSGFAFAQLFVSGSHAAAQITTTIPNPDPPPTTVPNPEPPPTTSVQRTPPPPPPPPQPQPQPQAVSPPSPAQSSPPPSPPALPSRVPTTGRATPRPSQSEPVGKQKARHAIPGRRGTKGTRVQLGAERQAAALRVAAPLAASSPSSPSSTLLLLALAVAFASALIAVASALLPDRALPRLVLTVIDNRRPDILFTGIAVILSIGIGLAIAQVL